METRKWEQANGLAVEATGLVKVYGKERAVDGVDLVIPRGTVYGFLGPNGAGKTTTIRMLSTLIQPDDGSASIFGHDLKTESAAIKSRISLTGQYASIDEDLTGIENLVLISRLMGYTTKEAKQRASELLLAFGLEQAAKRQVKKYSGGMRRRIDIAASIVVTPDLLFLDEPTTGLDPRSRNQVWEIVRALVGTGTTVLLTTQNLEEADQLADRIAVINHGKIIAEGTSSELKASVGTGTLTVQLLEATDQSKAASIIEQKLGAAVHVSTDGVTLSAQAKDSSIVAEALGELGKEKIGISDFALGRPSLDEVFLTLTGQSASDQPTEEEHS
ncbi:ATP-binding cassette domain-containing protein [Planococcus maritimus]|uniref:ATP-binding cassette domain-containing protein n=1 Tax=Planococcus maritimus TaxID=192421 RepID=UPI00079A46A3|nr:ATP-binding cassette domain-containing protein [Planococcus maritimus]KYG59930.1 caunorubicin/doxorubicin resistance ATP-binding protein [Planococcus maritimus]OED33622.1 daunorubicin/doxorubicin resistance ABC transporter ATP-binding protein DrrA [Planococcus maritimus]